MTALIPDSHLDLLLQPVNGVLTTIMADGQPQMSIVWADFDGEFVLINTTLERQKGVNMRKNPKVNLLLIDPRNVGRYIEIRGEVDGYSSDDAVAHVDKQTKAYSNNIKNRYYGDIYPEEQQIKETRVIFRINPLKVNTDAIFS
jgi:PPOX class probable F420-dependent enzyme